MQFLGRISMSLYLIHVILMQVVKLVIWKWTGRLRDKMPVWVIPNSFPMAIPHHFVISIIVATLITFFIEDPTRKFLNKMIAKRKEINQLSQENILVTEEGKPLLEH